MAIRRAVVYHAQAFSAGIKCRHCSNYHNKPRIYTRKNNMSHQQREFNRGCDTNVHSTYFRWIKANSLVMMKQKGCVVHTDFRLRVCRHSPSMRQVNRRSLGLEGWPVVKYGYIW